MFFDIPLFFMITFLLSTAVIVFYSIGKFTSFRVYAVGNRQFSTASLVATSLATFYGGATFIISITNFSLDPLWIMWRLLGIFIPFFILSCLSVKMSKFIYHISMPETMARVYGKYPRIITALMSVFLSITLVATQLHILSEVISSCINSVNPIFVTMLAAILLVVYTILGGSRAVVLTDIWQFITFVTLICLLGWFMFTQTGRSIKETIALITTHKEFGWSEPLLKRQKLAFTFRYLAFIFAFIEPGYMQHIYMAAQPTQAKKACLYAGVVGCIVMICCIVTGTFAFLWLPPDLPRQESLHYLLTHISPLCKGIFCTCLLALTMSTADSRLHISAIMISYDIVPVILPLRLRKKLSCMDHYKIAYIAILLIVTLSILLCLHIPYFFSLRCLTDWINRLYIPMVAAPFILAVLGFRTSSTIALIGMATGALAVSAWRKWIACILRTDSSFFPCVLVSGLTMLALHYVWTRSKRKRKGSKVRHQLSG